MRDKGTNSGVKMKCDICKLPLEGTMIGYGDGTGSRFAHPDCYYRRERNDKDAEIGRLKAEVERLRGKVEAYEPIVAAVESHLQRAMQILKGGKDE